MKTKGQILAIDYGSKRCGIATTDEMQLIASGLTTVPRAELLVWLTNYLQHHEVVTLLFGEPKRLHGDASAIESDIKNFIIKLKETFPSLSIERQDERFTSKMAFETMLVSGISKKKRSDKALVDKISATLILQSYLEAHSG